MVTDALQALRRGITRARGFSLFIAVCDDPAIRDHLIRVLQESVPWLHFDIVRLESDPDPLDTVRKQIDANQSGPVMLVDLEHLIGRDASDHPILSQLNLARPEWPQYVPRPLVLWVPEHLLSLLGRRAPDFLDWRSDTVSFVEIGIDDLKILQGSSLSIFDERLRASDRRVRVAELKARLAVPYPDERSALVVRAGWLLETAAHLTFLKAHDDARKAAQDASKIQDVLRRTADPERKAHPRRRRKDSAELDLSGVDQRQFSAAADALEESVKKNLNAGYYDRVARNFAQLSEIALCQGNLIRAKYLAEWARDIDEWLLRQGEVTPAAVAEDWTALGRVMTARGDAKAAKRMYKQAYQIQSHLVKAIAKN